MSLESTTASFLCAHQDTVHVRSRGALCWSNFYFSCCHFPTLAPYPHAHTCACPCPVRQPSTAWMQHHSSYCNQIESVLTKPKQALPKKEKSGERFIACIRYDFQSNVLLEQIKHGDFCSGIVCSHRESTLGTGTLMNMLNFRFKKENW